MESFDQWICLHPSIRRSGTSARKDEEKFAAGCVEIHDRSGRGVNFPPEVDTAFPASLYLERWLVRPLRQADDVRPQGSQVADRGLQVQGGLPGMTQDRG